MTDAGPVEVGTVERMVGRVPGTVDRRLARDVARAYRVPLRAVFMSGPCRLRIDGHAYHRRTNARRRRR